MRCPGYCGRILLNGSLSPCTGCPRGFRTLSSLSVSSDAGDSSQCLPCSDPLSLQDWLYLLFMVFLLLLIEWYIVDCCVKRRDLPIEVLVLHASAAAEIIISALLVLLIVSDAGRPFSFTTHCRVNKIADWYTIFWNPRHVSCTQEAVYPLFSMVFMFYGIALISLLLIRPLVAKKSADKNAIKTIFLTLYVIPGLAFVHSVLSGVVYFLFPYITIIGSVISVAVHMACRLDQRTSALFKNSINDARNATIILGHWLLHVLGLVALTHMKNLVRDLLLVACVPLPTLFYILSSKYSDPAKIHRS